jgi:hypothetical protein
MYETGRSSDHQLRKNQKMNPLAFIDSKSITYKNV